MSVGNISELIAKKNYGKAIEAIRSQLKAGKHNPQLHMQLADVLILAKKPNEGIQILLRVADEFAHDGFEAKAIAVLKKIDKLEPGRPDVQSKLRALVRKPDPAPPPASRGGGGASFELGMEEIGFDPPGASGGISVPAAPMREAEPPPRPREPEPELPSFGAEEPALELGLDSGPALDLGLDARPAAAPPPAPAAKPAASPALPKPAPPPKPVPAPVQDLDFGLDDAAEEEAAAPAEEPMIVLEPEPVVEPEPELLPEIEPEPEVLAEPVVEIQDIQLEPEAESSPAAADGGGFDDLFAQELMSAFDEAFTGGDTAAASEAPQAQVVRSDLTSNPLFKGFAPDELVAILEGLTLHTFEPGDIIIAQGDPGNSLFILTTGTVKAFINKKYMRDLEEGSFFGEVAILTGQPRTATITAKTYCELLELDRGTLDAISISHPHVPQVLQEFYEKRKRGEA